MEEEKKATLSLSPTNMFLAALALGIILLVIGFDSETSGLVDAGLIFTTLALFGGALLLEVEGYLRLGLAIAGGFVLAGIAPQGMGMGILEIPW